MGACLGIQTYKRQRKEIAEHVKTMKNYPNNPAMQALGARHLLEMMDHYEEPMVLVELMGKRATALTSRAVKHHGASVVCLRSAVPLLAELVKKDAHLQRVRKDNILDVLINARAEFGFDDVIVTACHSLEAALRGVHSPQETLGKAAADKDCDLALLVMKYHQQYNERDADVQKAGCTALAAIVKEDKGKDDMFELQGIEVVVAAMQRHPGSDLLQGAACTVFAEVGKEVRLCRDLGRLGAVDATVACLRNRLLWLETHQQAVWALNAMLKVESNIVHMKVAGAQFALSDASRRTKRNYRDWAVEKAEARALQFAPGHAEMEAAAKKKKEAYKPLPSAPPRNPTTLAPADGGKRSSSFKAHEKQPSAAEKAAAAKRKAAKEAAHRKKFDISEDFDESLAGDLDAPALFMPGALKRIEWAEYDTSGLEEFAARPDAAQDPMGGGGPLSTAEYEERANERDAAAQKWRAARSRAGPSRWAGGGVAEAAMGAFAHSGERTLKAGAKVQVVQLYDNPNEGLNASGTAKGLVDDGFSHKKQRIHDDAPVSIMELIRKNVEAGGDGGGDGRALTPSRGTGRPTSVARSTAAASGDGSEGTDGVEEIALHTPGRTRGDAAAHRPTAAW